MHNNDVILCVIIVIKFYNFVIYSVDFVILNNCQKKIRFNLDFYFLVFFWKFETENILNGGMMFTTLHKFKVNCKVTKIK